MSLIDKITKAFNLDNDDYDYDEDYDADDDYEEEEPKPAKVRRFSSVEKDNEDIVETKPAKTRSNVLSYNPKKKNADGKPAVCVFKPVNFEEGREVVDTLLEKNIVVLNLEGLDFETAQRIVDFACGACYSIDGTLKKITNFIFVIAPHNVGVAGDFPELLAESGIKL